MLKQHHFDEEPSMRRPPHVHAVFLTTLLCFAAVSWAQSAETPKPASPSAQETASKAASPDKAAIHLRVCVNNWIPDRQFADLIAMIDRHPGCADALSLFTSSSLAPDPDDVILDRCKLAKDRIRVCHEHGLKAGINVLCTLGHCTENVAHIIGPEFPRAVHSNGQPEAGILCPNQDIFRERIKRLYRACAEADPDFIWVDDDTRMGVFDLCYCDACLKRIAKKLGMENLTRPQLVELRQKPEIAAKLREYNSDAVDEIFALIEQAVHEVRPDLMIGHMSGDFMEMNLDFARWAKTLAGPNHAPVCWRPGGGGMYNQNNIYQLATKAHCLARQCAVLPPEVKIIQSEIENMPYDLMLKSRRVTAIESAVYIAAGCTGTAFNVLPDNFESLSSYDKMISELASWRPFYDLLVRHFGRRKTIGMYPVWDRSVSLAAMNAMPYLAEAGIPIAYSPEGNCGLSILTPESLWGKTKEEVTEYLKNGVYADVDLLKVLNAADGLNLGELTGVKPKDEFWHDCVEVYNDHPLNGKLAGETLLTRQSFWSARLNTFEPTQPGAASLTRVTDFGGVDRGNMAMAVFENPLGGRVCFNGYRPWEHYSNHGRQMQLKNVLRWLSKDRLPAYISSYERAHIWVREPDADGNLSMLVYNATYDDSENMTVKIRTDSQKIAVYDKSCKPILLTSTATDGPYREFTLPAVRAWNVALLTTRLP